MVKFYHNNLIYDVMKKLLILPLFFVLLIISGCAKKTTAPITPLNENQNQNQPVVGNDKDEHGCIGSAGYSWCEVKQKCLKSWEEKCEEVSTSTSILTNKIFTDTAKQISINFIDGYKKYSDNIILFGPIKKVLESGVNDKNQTHIYQLEIVNYKSAKEIVKNYNTTGTTTVKPAIIKIGNFEVAKYAEGGMCEKRTLEVIGTKYNYRFSADGCYNSQETDFAYLTKAIEQMKIVE